MSVIRAASARASALDAARARARMIERLRAQGIRNEKVLAAMAAVPRHQFVEKGLAFSAYDDSALPIGLQQTISQPYIVARMIEILCEGRELGRTLEIGAGCGYQAAVLSQLAREVYAIERLKPLLDRARENLRPLRLPNLRLKYADGTLGLPEAAPFDTIIVAAGGLAVPPALKAQLAREGRLLIPVGGDADQRLLLIERQGSVFRESRCDPPVRFVPLLTGAE